MTDVREYARYFMEQSGSSEAASIWMTELDAVINGLSEMPDRFKTIEEQSEFELLLRQVLHYSHRVVFHVDQATTQFTCFGSIMAREGRFPEETYSVSYNPGSALCRLGKG